MELSSVALQEHRGIAAPFRRGFDDDKHNLLYEEQASDQYKVT